MYKQKVVQNCQARFGAIKRMSGLFEIKNNTAYRFTEAD